MRKFTLIELLVVVAIIGILTSILMPSIASARLKAISAVCKSNLGQTGKELFLGVTENDDTILNNEIYNLPDFASWSKYLRLQDGSTGYNCPELYDNSLLTNAFYHKFNVYGVPAEDEGLQVNLVDNSTESIMSADSWDIDQNIGRWELGYGNNRPDKSIPIMIHLEKANLLFFDGHVQAFTQSGLQSGRALYYDNDGNQHFQKIKYTKDGDAVTIH